MKFVLKFYGYFIFLILLIFLIVDRTNEMLAYVVWLIGIVILYAPVLFVIHKYLKGTTVFLFLIKLLVSLLLFNILLWFFYKKNIVLVLLKHEWDSSEFLTSLMLLLIFIVSFIIASMQIKWYRLLLKKK